MHTFSVLISPSGPLAGSKVVIIGNSGHAVASGYRKHAATSEKALIHATFQSVVMILINFKSKSGSQLLNESKELFFLHFDGLPKVRRCGNITKAQQQERHDSGDETRNQ